MRLVACPNCHAQFDVTGITEPELRCPCGATVPNVALAAVEAEIRRCAACGAALAQSQERCEFCGSPVVRDRRRLSLICPECFARNEDRARYCTSCGVEFSPQPVYLDRDERACPCCGAALLARSIGGVRVEECPECNGLWVPGAGFDRLLERATTACRDDASAGARAGAGFAEGARAAGRHAPVGRRSEFATRFEYRRCPVCDSPMHRKNFRRRSGIIVDWCRDHGTWLDADELEDIAAYLARTGSARDTRRGGSAGDDAGAWAGGDAGAWAGGDADVRAAGGSTALSADQLEALLAAERSLAVERERAGRRHRRLVRSGGEGWRRTLGDLFDALLGD